MARILDLPFELLMMIIDLVFLDTNCKIRDFDEVFLEIRRPSRALLQTCRMFHKLGKDRIHQMTAVEIYRQSKPTFSEHSLWNRASQLLKQCPDGAKTLTLRYFEHRGVVRNICENMKGLEAVHWVTAQQFYGDVQPQPVDSPPADTLAVLNKSARFVHLVKYYTGVVGKIPSLELVFTVIRYVICGNHPILSHRVESKFSLRLGASKTMVRLGSDKIKGYGDDCDCLDTPLST